MLLPPPPQLLFTTHTCRGQGLIWRDFITSQINGPSSLADNTGWHQGSAQVSKASGNLAIQVLKISASNKTEDTTQMRHIFWC